MRGQHVPRTKTNITIGDVIPIILSESEVYLGFLG